MHFMTPSLAPIVNKQAYMKNKRLLVEVFVRISLNDRIKQVEMQKRGLLYNDVMNMIY